MNRILVLPLILITLFSLSCAAQIPSPKNSNTGLVAIPIKATSSASTNFGFAYKLLSTFDPGVSITIYPSIAQDFAFSKELPPGKYYFDSIQTFLQGTNTISKSSSEPKKIQRTILVDVQAGTITIANEKLVVTVVKTDQKYIQNKVFTRINNNEMPSYVNNLKELDSSAKWRIVGSD